MKDYAYLKRGYRVKAVKRASGDHWQGGEASHEGATCPVCKRPFLLLWDINCRDPRFRENPSPVFGDLERLPLYYCWTCGNDRYYQVVDRVRVFGENGSGKPRAGFPYKHYPKALDRRPIEVANMPNHILAIASKWKDLMGEQLSSKEKQTLSNWFGHELLWSADLWCHQIGAEPWLIQGPEKVPCTNPDCSRRKRNRPMKVLAAIHNDPKGGLPLVQRLEDVQDCSANSWVQVVYHICPECLTLHAGSRCD
jgi:hypothetical protein